jgi:peptide/nickel transport system permease protein
MQRYIVRRLLLNIPVLFGVTLIAFALVRILPGDAVTAMVAESGNISDKQMGELRHRLGLDEPYYRQYFDWLVGIPQGDFGKSLRSGIPVRQRLVAALPTTIELAILAISISLIIAIPAGIISAVYRNSPIDYASRFVSILGLSLPGFWIGTLALVLPAVWLDYLPPLSFVPLTTDPEENLKIMIVPAICAGVQRRGCHRAYDTVNDARSPPRGLYSHRVGERIETEDDRHPPRLEKHVDTRCHHHRPAIRTFTRRRGNHGIDIFVTRSRSFDA